MESRHAGARRGHGGAASVGRVECTAELFIERLTGLRSPASDQPDDFSAVGMGQIFRLARECMDTSPMEIERLLESPIHAVRVGAVSVMDWQAPAAGGHPMNVGMTCSTSTSDATTESTPGTSWIAARSTSLGST